MLNDAKFLHQQLGKSWHQTPQWQSVRIPTETLYIYRPPKNNNNNQSIELFIEEFSTIVDKISKNMSHGMIVGDFNINLLQIQEREKFGDFFDLMCVNGFLPNITFPTRFAKKSCSLIDQIFCRFPESHINF